MFLLVPAVFAAGVGTCVLDSENYVIGETATFICSCTHPQEENVDGNFVWLQSNGTVLQNTTTNSGSCRTSAFSVQYEFLSNYTGNVTFVTDSVHWADPSDVVSADFNVSVSDVNKCIISDLLAKPVTLGDLGSVRITLYDSETLSPIVNARCSAGGYDSLHRPYVFEPYDEFYLWRISSAKGHVGFQRNMLEPQWEINSDYFFEFKCFCPSNDSEEPCFYESTGGKTGFKSCSLIAPFTTDGKDLRGIMGGIGFIIIGIIILTIFYFAIGLYGTFVNPKVLIIQLFGYVLALFHILSLFFVVYMEHIKEPIYNIVEIVLYGNLLIAFAIIFLILIMFTIRLIHPKESVGEDEKWRKM